MARRSAGILMYKLDGQNLKVLLVHPGGPFWAKKDLGSWSVPKGEYAEGEDPRAAAIREFAEETGSVINADDLLPLGEIKQRGGKVVTAWALGGELDAAELVSNTFEMEWPPKSGKIQRFPEVDRADWFEPELARQKLVSSQSELIDRLVEKLRQDGHLAADAQ